MLTLNFPQSLPQFLFLLLIPLSISKPCLPNQTLNPFSLQCQCSPPSIMDNTQCLSTDCHLGCAVCSQAGSESCETCMQGYHYQYHQVGKCQVNQCEGSCQLCVGVDRGVCPNCKGEYMCGRCQYGAVLFQGECRHCGGDCGSCSPYDIFQCQNSSISMLGFSIDQDTVKCPNTCAKCSSSGCIKCHPGYKLNVTVCQIKCIHPCQTCQIDNPNTCLTCIGGYQLSSSHSCKIDIECNSDTSCTICPLNYYLNNSNCVECQSLEQNCVSCNELVPIECIGCRYGFFLRGGLCRQCVQGCVACDSNNFCTQCQVGYFMGHGRDGQPMGICAKCNSVCKECQYSSKKCTKCTDNWHFSANNPYRCQSEKRIYLQMVLATDLDEFLTNTNSFVIALAEVLGTSYSTNPFGTISLTSASRGSTIIQAMIDVPSDDENAASFVERMATLLHSGNSIGNYTITSSEIQANFVSSQQSEDNLLLVLGITIPLTIILFAVIGFVTCKKHNVDPTEKQTKEVSAEGQNKRGSNSKSRNTDGNQVEGLTVETETGLKIVSKRVLNEKE